MMSRIIRNSCVGLRKRDPGMFKTYDGFALQ